MLKFFQKEQVQEPKSAVSGTEIAVERIKTPKLVCNKKIEIPLQPVLDDNQLEMLKTLEQTAQTFLLPVEAGNDRERQREILWLDQSCLLRYLRATKWDLKDAEKRLKSTMEWRREYKPYHLSIEDLRSELEVGKVYLNGFDKSGQPILYMVLRRGHSGDWERGLRYSIYSMEKAFKIMPAGVEKLCILVDFKEMKSGQPLSVSKKWIDIMSSHYPERLGHSFLINTSWYISAFLKIVFPFIDPVSKSKIHLISSKKSSNDESNDANGNEGLEIGASESDIRTYVHDEELDAEMGGKFNFEFEIEEYLKAYLAIPCPATI